MSKTHHIPLALLAGALVLCCDSTRAQDSKPAAAPAATEPQAKRTIFEHHDQSGVADKEIVNGTADLPAGTMVGWHTHPGDESGYVLKGNLVLKTRGQPDRVLKAGDYFFNVRGAVHSLLAAPGSEGGTAYSVWIVDKGKPMAEPVKE